MPRPVPLAFLVFTAVVCGALVMVIEILGSRVIGPFFGVSLFVWTALITVTLLALAGGYAAGGWLADRHPSADVLYALIAVAGIATLGVPLAKAAVIKAAAPLGLRAGSLAASLLLFGPALFLLGCVTPYVVKLASSAQARLGRTVGTLYALSTLGSVAGTLATGFILIAWLGVGRIFQVCGAALLLLSLAYFVGLRRRWPAMALALVPFVMQPAGATAERLMPDGTRVQIVHARDSFYGAIRVVEYSHGAMRTRELIIDGLVQGGVDAATGESVYEYSYLLQWLPTLAHPQGTDCLVIGLGVGAVPRWYAARGVRTVAVEISEDVAALAGKHFGIERSMVRVADARQYLATSSERYDYVVMDAYTGDSTPAHLLTQEAFKDLKRVLKEDGVVAFNLHGTLGAERVMTLAILRTIASQFPELRIYPLFDPRAGENWGNIIVIAGKRLPPPAPAAAFAGLSAHPLAAKRARAAAAELYPLPDLQGAALLTDDNNAVDLYDVRLKETMRRAVLADTHWDILLD